MVDNWLSRIMDVEESSELSGQFFEDETRNACDLSYFYVLINVRIVDG